jgi:hypothetical protein
MSAEQLDNSDVVPVSGQCDFVGDRYTIRTLKDLYMIPPAKLEHCLRDIFGSIELHREVAKLSGVVCDPLEEIEWFDDGKHDLAMIIKET